MSDNNLAPVTDPATLAQLNAQDTTEVTDPTILAQLNAPKPDLTPSVMDYYSPSTGEYKDPTAGMTAPKKFAAGAGKAVSDIGMGLEQIGAQVGQKLGLVSPKTVAGVQQAIDEAKLRDYPLMRTTPGELGYISGNVATTMLPFGVAGAGARMLGAPRAAGAFSAMMNPTTYKAAAGTGAVLGAIQPVASGDWAGGVGPVSPRVLNTVSGMLAGMGGNLAVSALGRVAQPFVTNPEMSAAAQVLTNAGLPLDLSQRTGNVFLKRMKMALEDNPVTAGAQKAANDARQEAFNRAALSGAGIDATHATRDVLGPGMDAVNGEFKDILGRNTLPVTIPFLNDLGTVQAKANLLDKKAPSNVVNHLFDMMLQNGEIKGTDAYSVKKDIDGLMASDDSTVRSLGGDLHDILMTHFKNSMPEADQAALTAAQQKFRILKTIEPAVSKDGLGNISPSLLANQVAQKRNRAASMYGRGSEPFLDLVDLAQSGRQVLPDMLGNSGTFGRGQMGLIPLATGLTIGKPLQALMNTGSRYAAEGIPPGIVRSVLEAPRTSPIIGGALRRLPANYPESNSLSNSLMGVPEEAPAAPTTNAVLGTRD